LIQMIMKKILSFGLLVLTVTACQQQKAIESKTDITVKPYPQSQKGSTQDTYFGTLVDDPYRWLEDDLSAETKNWVKAENEVTEDYLSQIPYREQIRKRLETLWNYEKVTAPSVEGNYVYFFK